MKSSLPLLIAAMLGVTGLHAAEPLTEPGSVIVGGENDQAWRPLFSALAEKTPLVSTFAEHRWFPFRNRPVDLTGELRFSREHGLSLHYSEPEPRTMIVDEAGILLRDDRGRSRAVPSHHRTAAASIALLSVLRSDLDALLDAFEVRAIREDDDWRFDFAPRTTGQNDVVDHITVWGHATTVQRLEIRRASNQRVEIDINETTTRATFTAQELEVYFR